MSAHAARCAEERIGGSVLNNLSFVHKDDAIGDLRAKPIDFNVFLQGFPAASEFWSSDFLKHVVVARWHQYPLQATIPPWPPAARFFPSTWVALLIPTLQQMPASSTRCSPWRIIVAFRRSVKFDALIGLRPPTRSRHKVKPRSPSGLHPI